jgi:prepilin-type N-terminal cleavage/methylation domain-containing protein
MMMRNKKNGFSLVELLVAALILAIATVSVVSMVRKSREIQLSDNHRQEVRTIINAEFEKSYGYKQFASIPVRDTIMNVTIDPRGGTPLTGTMYVSIDSTSEPASGTSVPLKKVTLAIGWTEADSERDSLSLTKWVAE